MKALGVEDKASTHYIDVGEEDAYELAIKQVKSQNASEEVMKSLEGTNLAYSEPNVGFLSMNPEYRSKPRRGAGLELHDALKQYSNHIVLNAIINTRANQVASYCEPARYSDKGIGFHVRLRDVNKEPSARQVREMEAIEKFILNTGINKDVIRGNFTNFAKKIVRDTYTYDQVNFEKVFTNNGRLHRFVPVDPSTIYIATDEKGKLIEEGDRYVQVMNSRVVATFSDREMAFAVRNPRSDIYAAGYGFPELEIALRQFIAHTNTEVFNDRFFSHGGTTRGLLQIKTDQNQSQHALNAFKREWRSTLKGVNGSWQIPVISAEDVKFVNMTPAARDLEFEGWLSYQINMITALYQIDPAEIGFPNNGGATGKKGSSLNEGNSEDKMNASKNKGLYPLLKFISDIVNDFVVSEFPNSDDYVFQFVGGDFSAELARLKKLSEEVKIGKTFNEARKEMGLSTPILGGDVPASGVVIQRIGQEIQKENVEYERSQARMERLIEQTGKSPETNDSSKVSFQDKQQGLAGNSDNVDGKDTFNSVGKDGQEKKKPTQKE